MNAIGAMPPGRFGNDHQVVVLEDHLALAKSARMEILCGFLWISIDFHMDFQGFLNFNV